ncbi:MAG: PBP1A family penicillin-binding protein, partial [Candidatus Beckwithbacteria bacterium]|nr:PBP1A family penicillin-binding protein [Candidatus Beckwithbacteria bacterium]
KVVRREGFSTKIFDRNGELLYDVFADQRRTPVTLDQVPVVLREATVAIEDKNFYKHEGFDPWGLVRALFNSLFRFRRLAGGSTLTQQLVKNVLLTPERAVSRKIKEFVLSVQIEKKYSKDQILQMYLNESPYGGTAWGVEAAAETYFEKKVSELNLVEAAILAGLPQSPTRYSPFGQNPEAYKDRTKDVFRRMREDGYLSKDQEKEALAELDQVEFAGEGASFKAPHFVMYVRQLLIDRYGEKLVEQGGLKVTTSLDLELQEEAQDIVSEEIARVESLHITNGAALVLDTTTGEILAMVGSKDYFAEDYEGKVNVNLALRQPGSAIKPVTYAAAFKQGLTPAKMIVDVATEFPGGANAPVYKPKNYDNKDHGPVQLRQALGSSLNIPAVKLLHSVGVKNMLDMAYRLGFSTLEPTSANVNRFGLSVTLGGGEVRLIDMVSGYSAFANGGLKVEPVSILKVEDQNGKTLEEFRPVDGTRVLTEAEAFLISDILSDNNARLITFGANSLLKIPNQQVAVKTGTTDDQRDNWAVGWSPDRIVGAWVGNNDNSKMKQVASGVSGATPIWRRIMLEALKGQTIKGWPVPNGVVSVDVDAISGQISHDGWPSRTEYMIKGTEPVGADTIHTNLKLCRGQTLLASDTMVARGDYEEKEFIVLREDDPSGGGRNRYQEGIDAWRSGQGDERYHFPTEFCGESNEVVVQIEAPADRAKIGNDFTFSAKVTANSLVKKVIFYADGVERKTLTDKPFTYTQHLETGVHTLKVRAEDENGNSGESQIKIGVNVDWDYSPSSTPSSSPSALPASPGP